MSHTGGHGAVEISSETCDLLEMIDGIRTVGELLGECHADGERGDTLLNELLNLWSLRLVKLRPPGHDSARPVAVRS